MGSDEVGPRADDSIWARGGNRFSDTSVECLRVSRVVVSTDGFVSEAGEAGWAFVTNRGESNGGALSNVPPHVAEWVAMSEALAWAEATLVAGDELVLRTDSALVAKGLHKRKPAMSGDAAEMRAACRQALARLGARGVRAVVERVPRAENEQADALSRRRYK